MYSDLQDIPRNCTNNTKRGNKKWPSWHKFGPENPLWVTATAGRPILTATFPLLGLSGSLEPHAAILPQTCFTSPYPAHSVSHAKQVGLTSLLWT